MIEEGQIYVSARPTHVVDGSIVHTRIKVVKGPVSTWGPYSYGKVGVVTLTEDGRELRYRHLHVRELHESAITKHGQVRRNGYILERKTMGEESDG